MGVRAAPTMTTSRIVSSFRWLGNNARPGKRQRLPITFYMLDLTLCTPAVTVAQMPPRRRRAAVSVWAALIACAAAACGSNQGQQMRIVLAHAANPDARCVVPTGTQLADEGLQG